MWLDAAGKILQAARDALPDHYSRVDRDVWVIMPNHVHGIIVLDSAVGGGFETRPYCGIWMETDGYSELCSTATLSLNVHNPACAKLSETLGRSSCNDARKELLCFY